MAVALIAVFEVGTAAAIPPQTRYVAEGGADTGDCTSALTPCETIQYAVDRSNAGDTIEVAAGTYDEPQVEIDKPLILQGAGAGQTVIDGSSASNLPTHAGLLWFHDPPAGEFEIRGMTLEGANSSNATGEPMLITFSQVPAGSDVTVSEDELLASDLDPDLAEDFSLGIYSSGSGAEFAIEDNRFEGMWQGILIEHSTGATTIAGNGFANLVPTTSGGDVYPAEGVFLLADGIPSGAGDAVTSAQEVSENEFHDYAGLGVVAQAGYPGRNTTSPNSFSDLTIAGNQIALNGATSPPDAKPLAGIALKTGLAGSTIDGAVVEGNSVAVSAPGNDIGVAGAVNGAELHRNRLVGGSAAGLDAIAGEAPVDATDNWWGCNAGPGSQGCGAASGDIAASPNVVLTASAASPQVASDGSTLVTAHLDSDSDGASVPGLPDGATISFGASNGTFSPPTATLANGTAASTFASGAQAGEAGATVRLDSQTVPVPLSVLAPPVPPPAPVSPVPTPLESPPSVKPAVGGGAKTVPGSGEVTVASVACPVGTCEVAAKSPKVTIGNKAYKVTVKVPRTVAAGDSAPIKVVLSKAARAALAKEGKGRLTVKVTVTSSNGTTKTITVSVKLTGKKRGGKGR